MKYSILLLFVIILNQSSYSQENNKKSAIEIDFGINHLLSKYDIETKTGFGVSIKKVWFSETRFNLISGILFEKTKYYKAYDQCGHFCHYEDMTYNLYSFAIPLMLRANAGEKYRVFIQIGPAFEITPLKWGKGIEVLYPPNTNTTEAEISADFEHEIIDFGANLGIGITFPIKHHKFVLTSAYHSSIQSIFSDQQHELTEFFAIKIGIIMNFSNSMKLVVNQNQL